MPKLAIIIAGITIGLSSSNITIIITIIPTMVGIVTTVGVTTGRTIIAGRGGITTSRISRITEFSEQTCKTAPKGAVFVSHIRSAS